MTTTTTHSRKPIKPITTPLSKCSPKFLLIISMASLLFLSLLSLSLFLSLSSASRHHNHPLTTPPQIQAACKATRFPSACQTSLTQVLHTQPDPPTSPNPVQIIQLAIQVSSYGLKTVQRMVTEIRDSSVGNQNRTTAANNCLDILRNSEYRVSLATDRLSRDQSKSARAAMSAALLYQYGCWSGLKYANDTKMVNATMSFFDTQLIPYSSNALSMMFSYDNFGNDTKSWGPPKTERDGFWELVRESDPNQGIPGGVPTNLKADVTVCKEEGEECRRTVQEAVDEAPDNVEAEGKRFVIRIKAGVYEETVRVPLEKRNVVFLGDGMGKTVITGSLNVGQPGVSTYNSATVGK